MYVVSYTYRDDRGFLVDDVETFYNASEANDFLVALKVSGNLVGKPIFEKRYGKRNFFRSSEKKFENVA